MNACCMLVVNLKSMLIVKYWTKYNVAAYLFSIGVWFGFVALYSQMVDISPRFFGLVSHLYATPVFWFALPLTVLVALLPDLTAQYLQFNYFPEPWDRLRRNPGLSLYQKRPTVHTPATHASGSFGAGSLASHTGFDFSMAETETKQLASQREMSLRQPSPGVSLSSVRPGLQPPPRQRVKTPARQRELFPPQSQSIEMEETVGAHHMAESSRSERRPNATPAAARLPDGRRVMDGASTPTNTTSVRKTSPAGERQSLIRL